MIVFVDTSAFLAILDSGDRNHATATRNWTEAVGRGAVIITSNYVVVETLALLQRRSDPATVNRFHGDILPVVSVEWVDESVHSVGVSAALASGKRGASVVDCVSFEIMRRLDIRSVLACDKHFAEAGFRTL